MQKHVSFGESRAAGATRDYEGNATGRWPAAGSILRGTVGNLTRWREFRPLLQVWACAKSVGEEVRSDEDVMLSLFSGFCEQPV